MYQSQLIVLMVKSFLYSAVLGLMFSSSSAWCLPKNSSRIVPQAYQQIALKQGVPSKMLFAIALQESRKSIGQKIVRPWPWTLNFAGEARRYQNSQQVVLALSEALDDGKTNIDVGLMQINMKYHGHRFGSLAQAVDPVSNVTVAAKILKEEFKSCDLDWWCAVGRYHSRRRSHSEKYISMVRELWGSLQ